LLLENDEDLDPEEEEQLRAAMAASLGAENAGGDQAGVNNYIFSDDSEDWVDENGQVQEDVGLIQQFTNALGFG
jgi:hypothetical protein